MRAAWMIAVGLLASPAFGQNPAKVPADYVAKNLKGFQVRVHVEVLGQLPDRFGRTGLDVLEAEFDDLNRVLVPKLRQLLHAVPVWVRWDWNDRRLGGAVAVYYGATGHEMAQEGMLKEKAGCIEIVTLKRIGELRVPGSKFQQIVTLHEMAHAVHHRLLGFEHEAVKSAYRQAVERGLYDNVTNRFGQKGPAYARTSPAEYFAEISCAFLDTCHFYPHNFRDLQIHDPVGFALAERVWKHPEQFDQQPARASKPASPGGRLDPAVERDGYIKLDRARSLIRQGKKAEAKEILNGVKRACAGSALADEADELLAGLP